MVLDRAASFIPRACDGCGRDDPGLEDCALFRPGGGARGRCEILRLIAWTARRHLALRYPERADRADDVVQDLWVRLAGGAGRGAPPGGPRLRAWIRAVVANTVTSIFRRERVIARKRCGACVHFEAVAGACGRAVSRDPSTGEEAPNPRFGIRVDPGTAVDALDPPCRDFLWRYRPREFEEAAEGAAAPGPDPAGSGEDRGREVLAALVRLARRGPDSLRRTSVAYRHYIREEPLEAIARSMGITARTARRDIRQALEELRAMLEEEPG